MENLLTNKTASLNELRDPKKVIEGDGDQPVEILNRNQLKRYFVPASAAEKIELSYNAQEAGDQFIRATQAIVDEMELAARLHNL